MKTPAVGGDQNTTYFELPFFHLRHIRENKEEVALILLKHKIFPPEDNEHEPSEVKHREALLKSLPEIIKGNTLQSMYEKVKVCPKCFSIYELIHKETSVLKKVGADKYFHSWAEMEEAVREKLVKYYKSGEPQGEVLEVPSTRRPCTAIASEIPSPERSRVENKRTPHYMMPTTNSPKKPMTVTTSPERLIKTKSDLKSKNALTIQNSKRQLSIGTNKFTIPNERIVFKETAAQVRDTKLHMGLPAVQSKAERLEQSNEHANPEDMSAEAGTVNLFNQKEPKIQSAYHRSETSVRDGKDKTLDRFVAGRATQYGKHAAFKVGLLHLIKKAHPGLSIFVDNTAIPNSFYHYSNFEHLKEIPIYRITTPKIAYKEIGNHSLPPDPHTIALEEYCAKLHFPLELLRGCEVYLVDDTTSILYTIISQPIPEAPEINHDSEADDCRLVNKKSRFVQIKTILVFLDFFDSFVSKREFFENLSIKCPYTTFVLFNLPGQQFTAYDSSAVLNNVYYKNCIDYFVYYLEESGRVDLTFEPFAITAFGNGANIALYWALHLVESVSSLKGMLVFNPFTYMDKIMEDSIMKCMYSFQHCPESFKEYMGYFYSILTQSADKIQEIQENAGKGAENSPLKIEDRIAIFKGCLAHVDFRKRLSSLATPIITVHSKNNCLVQIKHSHEIFDVNSLKTKISPQKWKK